MSGKAKTSKKQGHRIPDKTKRTELSEKDLASVSGGAQWGVGRGAAASGKHIGIQDKDHGIVREPFLKPI